MKIDVILGAGRPASEIDELGLLAERYGLGTFWNQSFPSRRDPLMMMASLARSSKRIRLGTLPVSPYEVHPLRLADSMLTFNEMCAGRASILIGGMGHSVMRVTGLQPVRRVTAVRDCANIIRGLAADEMLDYQGECYSLRNYRAEWATDGPPLVYVGSTGPQMLAMGGEVADGIMMSDVPLVKMEEVQAHIDRGLAKVGRSRGDILLSNFYAWHIKADRDASMREALRELVWRGFLLPWHTEHFLGVEAAAFVESKRDAFLQVFLGLADEVEGVSEDVVTALIENLTFAGGLDEIDRVIDQLRAFERAGLNEVALKVHDDPAEGIRLIGEHLVPALQ